MCWKFEKQVQFLFNVHPEKEPPGLHKNSKMKTQHEFNHIHKFIDNANDSRRKDHWSNFTQMLSAPHCTQGHSMKGSEEEKCPATVIAQL